MADNLLDRFTDELLHLEADCVADNVARQKKLTVIDLEAACMEGNID